jgi:hypothetical protein
MALVSAIAGKPGNSVQVKLIKKFKWDDRKRT